MLVLFGWHTNRPILIQVDLEWTPMQYNTALGFLACGVAGTLAYFSRPRSSSAISLIPILLGSLTLIEYVIGVNLFIDDFFFEHYITTGSSHIGRMAPNTAICFILAGASLILSCPFPNSSSRRQFFVATLGGALLISLSLIAALGYLTGHESFFGWGSMTRMAIHTTTAFFILGIGLVASSMEHSKAEKSVIVFSIITMSSVMLTVTVLAVMQSAVERDVKSTLQASLARTLTELDIWRIGVIRNSSTWSEFPGVKENALALLNAPRSKQSLLAHPSGEKLDSLLRPIMERFEYDGYILISPDYTNTASMLKGNIGKKNILADVKNYLPRAFAGETFITPPLKSEIPLHVLSGDANRRAPTMFSLAPVHDDEGNVIGVLAFRLSPFKNFTPILRLGILGRTGETYAFDASGQMLSESRFTHQLEQIGLIPAGSSSILNIEVNDPGVNLLKGMTPSLPRDKQPLTLMAGQAIQGKKGSNITGYRDYRGVTVVGSWVWYDPMDMGIATEIDLQEMYESYNFFRNAVLFLQVSMIGLLIVFATQLGRRRRELTQKETMFRAIADASPIGLYKIDCSGRYIYVNEKWRDITGISQEDALKIQWFKTIQSEDQGRILESWNIAVQQGKPFEAEYRIKTKERNSIWVRAHVSPDRDENDKIIGHIGTIADVTARIANERQLKLYSENLEQLVAERTRELNQTFKQLLHSEKLASLGRITGSISHEFNNPLQGIRNIIEILNDANLSKDEHRLSLLAKKECDRLADMIRNLRDFYKPSTGQTSAIDINHCIEGVLALQMKSFDRKGIKVQKHFSDSLPKIEAIEDQIKQVIWNLVQNASDAISDNNGEIIVSTEMQNSDTILITINDTGAGLSDIDKKLIFDPFFTTKGVDGTGLGLSICYSIVQAHGGNINVEETGKYTTFTVTLPASHALANVGDRNSKL
ncbi:MAG: PAS domain S-box protein [Candidatus Nitrohelix vancouverensis]|uniref:histidine kinase n=1 Tax=Candidatus Nitrohelix vancouverensis TaxID=2705534 RepID=A0A7T0C4Z7_9BACT|nr:MAG: PAS domain S-box protein [Candidatus Nitrohelix vancouverensis]